MIDYFTSVFAVVLNYNGFSDSKECIESLLNSNFKLRIIVVDNNSNDDSFRKLQDLFEGLDFISSKINLGYAGGMNLGIKYSLSENADYIILVNQDVVVSSNFLAPLINKFNLDTQIGIVSSKVLYKDNKNIIYCAGGRISELLCTGVAKYQGKSADKYANEDREISLAEGCFLIVKSEVFRKVGLLNEKYFMYLEDVEFSERVRKYYKIIFASESIIYHKSGAGKSWSQFTPLYNYYYTRNRLWHYKSKNIYKKIYVILLSIVILIIKTVSILIKRKQNKFQSLTSLWSGFLDGIHLLIK